MTAKNIYITKIIVTVLLAVAAGIFAAGTITGGLTSRVEAIERDHIDHSPRVLGSKIDYLIDKCAEMHTELKLLNDKILTVENDVKWIKNKNGFGRGTAIK